MTASYIAFHAAERPRAIALVTGGREITYAEFDRDLGKITYALQQLGRPAGSSAAVCCRDVYLHWLLLLGFERLEVTTVSIGDHEGEAAVPLLATVDFLATDTAFPAAIPMLALTPDWVQEVSTAPATAAPAAIEGTGDAPIRILRTSGTTGVPKRLHMTRRTRDAWLKAIQWFSPYGSDTRLLMTLPFSVEGPYCAMTMCLRAGGMTVMLPFNQTGAIPGMVARYGITYLTLLPVQLKQLLDEMPADHPKPNGLGLAVFGGALGNDLRSAAQARFSTRLMNVYGTNEVGFVSLFENGTASDVSIVSPMAEVEIVDDAGAPVPQGAAGWIRIRSQGMFDGYLDDPEATRRMLRDGWFYPGDIGMLLGGRRLRFVGRDDDLLDIGGVKFGPDFLEDRLRAQAGLHDVAACTIRNGAGVGEVYLGVVKAPGEDDGAYGRALAAANTLGLGKFYVVKLDRIPRNANGKIRRKQLKRALADEILRHDPAWIDRVTLDEGELGEAAERAPDR